MGWGKVSPLQSAPPTPATPTALSRADSLVHTHNVFVWVRGSCFMDPSGGHCASWPGASCGT